jgi:Uma2 family endonuclease
MNAHARIPMSFDEYLRWERAQPEKHELVRGEPKLRRLRSMAGGTYRHTQIAANLVSALRVRLRGGPCFPCGSDFKVKSPTGNSRYPDVTVECGKPGPKDLVADEPTVVVEVLSPSNDEKELRERRADYQAIPSVACIAFVDPGRPLAETWVRDATGWRTATVEGMEASLQLAAVGVSVPLAEAYEGVELDSPS